MREAFAEVAVWANELASCASRHPTVDACLDLASRLLAGGERFDQWGKALPNPTSLAKDVAEARAAYEQASKAVGADADRLIGGAAVIFPDELANIAVLASRLPALAAAPRWLWGSAEAQDGQDRVIALTNAETRKAVVAVLEALDEHGEGAFPKQLADLPLPPPGTPIAVTLADELRRFLSVNHALAAAPPEHRGWVAAARERGDDPVQIQRAMDRLETQRARVSPATFARMVEIATEAPDVERRDARIRACIKAVDLIAEFMGGTAEGTTPDLLQLKVGPLLEVAPAPENVFVLDHVGFGDKGARAPLSFRPLERQPYGEVEVPVLLRAGERWAGTVRLDCDVLTEQRKAWPATWPAPHPAEFSVESDDWRPLADEPGKFVQTLTICIPIRKPVGSERFDVAVGLTDEKRKSLAARRELKWETIAPEPLPLTVAWPDVCDPEFVTRHPIGPQGHHEILTQKVQQGESFAVLAPRRFGKTTLVRYLESLRETLPVAIPAAVTCTKFYGTGGLDYEKLWKVVSDDLQKTLGSAMPLIDGEIPAVEALDHIRKAAYQRGKKNILILFDEAQLFFPKGARGFQLGDRLKDQLETGWALSDAKRMAGVSFGLIGLPGLAHRAGTNLMGKLRPIRKATIDEAELRKLLLRISKGSLETTPEARREIAKQCDNLLILRQILDGLVRRLSEDGRAWATVDDVHGVVADIKQQLQDQPDAGVAPTLRDAFNEAESVNEWKPSAAFPVAIALVKAGFPGLRLEDALHRAAEILTQWAGSIQDATALHRLVYDAERAREQFAVLRDRGIFTDSRISSDFMHAWLLGLAEGPVPQDEEFRYALFACAAKRVRRARTVLEPLAEGGQAKVFLYRPTADETLVWREAQIKSDEDRRRFLETSQALSDLTRRARLRETGYQFIFDLREMGLLEGSEDRAIQVYRYIPGQDLSKHAGKLAPELVAEIGQKLALALAWLHKHNVLHRDIRPANVILSDPDLEPVLIDFGMAHVATGQMGTRVASEFAAPEVCAGTPRWSRAADVWALCKSLGATLKSKEKIGLAPLLAAATADDADKRPTAEDLVDRFGQVLAGVTMQERRTEAWKTVEKLVAKDAAKRWYQQIVSKWRTEIENLILGFHTDDFFRWALVADFYNQVLEASDRRLSLGKASGQYVSGAEVLATPEISTAAALRVYRSHGEKAKSDVRTPYKEIEKHVRLAATQLAVALALQSLPDLAEKMISGRSEN